ncbi:hypothetical protein [Solimonas terrae]|uniref:Uncharacterized protein n=1 Tax=Solimonas terrae TaxID=1396819 RepID=A0A6M2BLY9_9GAMM|nr:hypothetical protein [Solimonas terrae]NGY03175.1 hypothetical protein [Solimonas terrae]
MNLYRNPEFLRHAWLELTAQRLIAMPAIIGLIALIGAQLDERVGGLRMIGLLLFVLITVLWGAKLAGDSLNQELVQGTWDQQRLSGMGAWQMTLGKLLGGPVFAWYGGLFCLALYAMTATPSWATIRPLLTALSAAFALHALMLLSTLVAWRKQPRAAVATPRARGSTLLLVFIVAPQLMSLMFGRHAVGTVLWYGHTIAMADFVLLCALLAMVWSVTGLYRAMREELAFRDPPSVWAGFLLFLFVFSGGWFYGRPLADLSVFLKMAPFTAHLALCALIAMIAAYVMLFSERKDWVRLRRLVALWQSGQRRRAWELAPKWLASAVIAVLMSAAFALAGLVTEPWLDGIAGACTAAALLAFLIRDGAIVLGLNFTRDQRRADAAAGLYLAVLYALLPGVLYAFGLRLLATMFWPVLVAHQPFWLIPILLQTAVALDFVLRRWRQLPA